MSPAAAASSPQIALLGYGEVGQTLAADLHAAGWRDLAAWDRLFPNPTSGPARAAAASGHVRPATSMSEALRGRTLVISAVTAASCLPAAHEAAAALGARAFYLDLNSVAPETKRTAAGAIDAAGGRYVEAAVMSAISPKRIASPMLIGGPHAEAFEPVARSIGFSGARVFDSVLGRASAAKMCRSVMVKGLEALFAESLLAARRLGVEQTVLESLHDLFPHENWERIAPYLISRSLQHGGRRAEEMREAARAVQEAGIEPVMSLASAWRQDWAAAHRPAVETEGLQQLLDAMLDRAENAGRKSA